MKPKPTAKQRVLKRWPMAVCISDDARIFVVLSKLSFKAQTLGEDKTPDKAWRNACENMEKGRRK